MKHANSALGSKISAKPGVQGSTCLVCGADVRAKCGSRNRWHWAHINTEDCDTWSESEGEWHVGWKDFFPENWHEVVINPHRADIYTAGGLVVELQHSPITAEVVAERENFYGNMIWIFDATDYVDRCEVVCWVGEHPHPKCSQGRSSADLCLNNIDQVMVAKDCFFNFNGMPEELVNISEAPPYSKDIYFREKDIKYTRLSIQRAEEKISKYQEILNSEPTNQKVKKQLESCQRKLLKVVTHLKDREATRFLMKPFPVMREVPENIQVFDLLIPAWEIRFKWRGKTRSGNLACRKPVLWDVGSENHLVFFPGGTDVRDYIPGLKEFDEVLPALVVEKTAILNAIIGKG
jgi:hypothetical protein